MRSSVLPIVILMGLAGPAIAASDHGLGDGSFTDNTDLLRQGFGPDALTYPLDDMAPGEVWTPYFDVDWSVALRGSYTRTLTGERMEALVAPSLSLTRQGNRYLLELAANAEFIKQFDGGTRFSTLSGSSSLDYLLDRLSTVSLDTSFSLSQDEPGTPGEITDVVTQPIVFDGEANVGLTRQFGRFDLGLRGSIARTSYGPTTLSVAPFTEDNSELDSWNTGAGLRLGFEATPVLTPFLDLSVSRDSFDKVNAALGVRPDATSSIVRAGIAANWGEALEFEASGGMVLRKFEAASLPPISSTLYDMSLRFTPDTDWEFTAEFATELAPPGIDETGSATLTYDASASVAYAINDWLGVRGSAGWRSASEIGTTIVTNRYNWGAGLDYAINPHTSLSADYAYQWSETKPEPAEMAHRISLGITIVN